MCTRAETCRCYQLLLMMPSLERQATDRPSTAITWCEAAFRKIAKFQGSECWGYMESLVNLLPCFTLVFQKEPALLRLNFASEKQLWRVVACSPRHWSSLAVCAGRAAPLLGHLHSLALAIPGSHSVMSGDVTARRVVLVAFSKLFWTSYWLREHAQGP